MFVAATRCNFCRATVATTAFRTTPGTQQQKGQKRYPIKGPRTSQTIPYCAARNLWPCIRLARGKFELTNQDSAGGKNFSVQSGKVLKSSLFSHWKWNREICTNSVLQFQKPYQIVKSEYEKFCASKLSIWRQKWTAGVRHGTSLVVRRVWSGRIIVVILNKICFSSSN